MEQLTLKKFNVIDVLIKKCTKCGVPKSLENFCKNKNTKDGLNCHCRECVRSHEQKTKEQISLRRKQDRIKNKDKYIKKSRDYYLKNKDAICKRTSEYKNQNKEYLLQKSREYDLRTAERRKKRRDATREHRRVQQAEYRRINADEITKRKKKYDSEHREERVQRNKLYGQSINGKLRDAKRKAKRRKLGFNPINTKFKDSHYHHLRYDSNGNSDSDIGIFIPKEIHSSIYHDGYTGQGMEEINKLAIEWYLTTCNSNTEELLKLGFNNIEEFVDRYKPKDCDQSTQLQ